MVLAFRKDTRKEVVIMTEQKSINFNKPTIVTSFPTKTFHNP